MLQASYIKVGGKYKLANDSSGCYSTRLNSHGGFASIDFITITQIETSSDGQPLLSYEVWYKDGYKSRCCICIKPEHLEFMDTEEEKTKFSIGDTVKITKRLPGNITGTEDRRLTNGDVGKIGKVIDYGKGSKTYRVNDEKNNYLGRFTAEELEIANNFCRDGLRGPVVKITAVQGGIVSVSLGHSIRIINNGSIEPKKEKSFMADAIKFVKEQALKVANPDEFELRKAGLHDTCGDLTTEGRALRDSFLEELVLAKMVTTARAMNEEAKANK